MKGVRAMRAAKISNPLLLFAMGLITVILLELGMPVPVSGSLNSRVFTVAQMDAIFGDGTQPCMKTYNCITPFKSGSSDCGYCGKQFARRVCCNLGNETKCEYESLENPCDHAIFWVGAVNGSYATCDTCTAANYHQSGNCAGIRNATSGSSSCP
jgi:hypothetical protein